jgi:TRAP-type C4-dicarboxylate transport system substrate-binding protein
MKKVFWLVVVAFVFSLAGLSAPFPGNAQEKVVTLNFALFFPAEHAFGILFKEWCEEVGKRTDGKVKATLFPGGTLSPPAQVYAGVVSGIADVGLSFCAYTTGRFPLADILTHPLGYKNAYQTTKVAHAFYKKFKPKEFDEVKVLILQCSPPQVLSAKKPVRTLADVKGLKTRAGGGVEAAMLKAWGAVPVAMPAPDIYDALSKGAIQATMGTTEQLMGYKLAEIVTHVTYFTPQAGGAGYVVMNKNKWNAIPPDAQKVIDQMSDEYAEKLAKTWQRLFDLGEEFFLQKGVKKIVLSKEEDAKWIEAVEPVVAAYVKKLDEKGLPGDEALKFCRDYIKAH